MEGFFFFPCARFFKGKFFFSPPRVMEAGANDTIHIHISHNQILFKSPAPRYNIHLLVYNQALAVKYKLVLTANHVYMSNNHTIIRREDECYSEGQGF